MSPNPEPPTADREWTHARIAIVAIAGNRLIPREIVELGIALIIDGELHEPRTWLARPWTPIDAIATAVHGISNADVTGLAPIQDHRAEILSLLDGVDLLVGHNLLQRMDVMTWSFPGWTPPPVLDTVRLTHALLPSVRAPRISLPTLITTLKLGGDRPAGQKRRAGWESTASGRLLVHLAGLLEEPVTIAELLARDHAVLGPRGRSGSRSQPEPPPPTPGRRTSPFPSALRASDAPRPRP